MKQVRLNVLRLVGRRRRLNRQLNGGEECGIQIRGIRRINLLLIVVNGAPVTFLGILIHSWRGPTQRGIKNLIAGLLRVEREFHPIAGKIHVNGTSGRHVHEFHRRSVHTGGALKGVGPYGGLHESIEVRGLNRPFGTMFAPHETHTNAGGCHLLVHRRQQLGMILLGHGAGVGCAIVRYTLRGMLVDQSHGCLLQRQRQASIGGNNTRKKHPPRHER